MLHELLKILLLLDSHEKAALYKYIYEYRLYISMLALSCDGT